MKLIHRRIFWSLIWIVVVFAGPVTVLVNTPVSEALGNRPLLINILQRMSGLVAFSLLFVQIILGAFMGKWTQILGAKAYWVHINQGLLAYVFIFIHPITQMLLDYEARGLQGALLTFLPGFDIFLNFGKLAFVFLTAAVVIGYFRTKPFLRRNWRKLHILNYLAFFLIAIHSRNLGTDVSAPPFVFIFSIALLIVPLTIVYRLIPSMVKIKKYL